jgi:hypothetical protein
MKKGRFLVSPVRTVVGELRVAGPQSSVVLRHEEDLNLSGGRHLCVTGSLYDQTQVSLIDCLPTSAVIRRGSGAASCSTTLFPHFVAHGRVHLDPDKPTIHNVSFTFEDATALFYDFDAFGALVDSKGHIEAITEVNAKLSQRPIRTGPHPHIAYFAGQEVIAEAVTAIGRFTAQHRPTWPTAGPKGVRIDNEIWLSLSPDSPITLEDATDRILVLLRFITLAVGRRQTVRRFSVETGEGDARQTLEVFWSHHPHRYAGRAGQAPHPYDLPLDPVRRPEEFKAVLTSWLARDAERCEARVRIDDAWARGNHYSIDRLVGAANAFDLLPESAAPRRVALSPEVKGAAKSCQAKFRELSASDERESLLRAIGRLGRATLKQKVRHRASIIIAATGNQYFSSLDLVCNQAVEARNRYVHGSSVEFDLASPSRVFGFLTDTLEFVFAASEFIESGWDILRALKAGTTMTHPFGTYAATYRENLEALRASMRSSASAADAE